VNVTGSSLPLLRQCQWWAHENVIAPPPSPPSESMLLGTEVHSAIENYLCGRPVLASEDAKPLFAEWLDWWKQSHLSALGDWRAEQAFAYVVAADTARLLDSRNRRYDTKPGEIAGTVDALYVDAQARYGIVVDWKTGHDFGRFVADAEDNWQLKLYALCAARAFNLDSIRVMVVRISDDGVSVSEHLLDSLELDAVAATVASLVAKIHSAQPKPGGHCRRCRAVSVCPTTAQATTALVAPSPVEIAITNPEQATAALIRLRQVQAACDQIESMLKTYATEQGGIRLPDGKTWKRVPVERESINLSGPEGAIAMAAISAAGAEDAVEHKAATSKAAIERAIKAQGLKGKELRGKIESLLSEMRAAGAVRSTTVEAWRELED